MKNNNENYPLYEVEPFDSIRDMLSKAVSEAGDKAAFKYRKGGQIVEVTYKEFADETDALGTAVASIGMGDRHIACIGENSYRWVVVYLTALKSSGVYVPVDKELPAADIITVLNHSDSSMVFYSAKYEKILKEHSSELTGIKYFVGLDRTENDGNFLAYEDFLAKGKALLEGGDTSYISMTSDPMALKMLVYTSGTTGMAKGVMLSEHNISSCVYYGLQVSTVYDTSLSVLPYNHTYESVAGLLVSLHHHTTICINENLKTVLKNLQEYHPDFIYLVPAFAEVFYKKIWSTVKKEKKEAALKLLIKTSDALLKLGIDKRSVFFKSIHETFGGKLVKIVCGGAPIRPEIGSFFESVGIPLINGYGITECSPLVAVNRDYFNDPGTAGVVLPCCQIRLDGINAAGEGEIGVKGDIVMLGYYKNPELTAEVLHDGWFMTGDYGKMNAKGQLLITGRKKNLIVLSNGKNVFPEEIENYISAIPYVSEVVVYSIKDARGLESYLGAEVYVSPEKAEEAGLDAESLPERIKADVAKCLSSLPVYKHVAKVYIRDCEFDKTTSNKIKRASVKFKDSETL